LFFDRQSFRGLSEEDENSIYKRYFNRLYFTVSTLSSTGYGDVTAHSPEIKCISLGLQFILILSVIGGMYYSL